MCPGYGVPGGGDHMPYLQGIWAAPHDAGPLLRYAEWLRTVGFTTTAAFYQQKAGDVAGGRLRPDYPDRSPLMENWD